MTRFAQLCLADILPAEACFHLARAQNGSARHAHDFAEVFWVEQGVFTHEINGRRFRTAPGEVYFVAPDDVHALAAIRGHAFTIVNVAFSADEYRALRRRYADELTPWPWDLDGPAGRLDARALQELAARVDAVTVERRTRLALDQILTEVLRQMEQGSGVAGGPAPSWLRDAMQRFHGTDCLEEGVPALARLAGRSPEHVTRTARRHFGCTATELINGMRMAEAERLLRMTDRPILDVALDCGLSNVSHFYRLFRARFGTTPRRYRAAALAGVVPRAGQD